MYSSVSATPRERFTAGQLYTLPDDTAAIQVLPSGDGIADLGPVSKLPRGAQILPCGRGFDHQTLMVSCHGHFYYLFVRDLEPFNRPALGIN